jgi:acetyltransferase-like isoleucine patch superfamily enzyme
MRPLLLLKNVWIQVKEGLMSPVLLARYQKKYPTCRFYPGATVDDNSSLGKFNVIFRNTSIINSKISDHTFIQKESIINNADVGKFCSVAMHVNIGLAQHAASFVSTHPVFYLLNTPLAVRFSSQDMFSTEKRTIIGNDVWIGQGSMIIGGVTIGTGAIIGTGAVVTKDIPEYAIAVGIPAQVVKYRFEEKIIKRLIASKWWEIPDDELQKKHHLFMDPLKLLESLERQNEE